MSLEEFVEATINGNKVVIFSKSYCPFCNIAKEAFNALEEPYVAVELDKRADGAEIQKILGAKSGVSTVPQVFVHKKFIGGGTDVKNLHAEGKLAVLVAGAP